MAVATNFILMRNKHMARSIATRTFHIVLYSVLATLCLTLGFAWWGMETLESTMLEAENRTEIEYFKKFGDKKTPLHVSTAQVTSVYQPNGQPLPDGLPIIFQGLPVPFQGEVDTVDTSFFVITHAFAEGNLYIAKNLQLFEKRETALVHNVLILISVICIIAFGLAAFAGRNISRPVVRLTSQLGALETETSGMRMNTDYEDSELTEIAHAMNHFLQRLEDSVTRERNLISMASHELKTPVSVILGAARVIESRGKLNPNDEITLNRIIDAAKEMSSNIHALLNLSRRTKETANEVFYWSELFESIRQDYQLQNPHLARRLQLSYIDANDEMFADQVLIKILLHNLINNALNHTHGDVKIILDDSTLTVLDEGTETLTSQTTP
ncbi:MAG TPA: HAMP domain-containing histidine kinase, partial [Candidatus Tenderia electrophaga]|nr:HAMP domain-containing histidine kinase [Candidatus Tenderia electrophaga]